MKTKPTEGELLATIDGALSAVLDAIEAADREIGRDIAADINQIYKRVDRNRSTLDGCRYRAARR